MNVIVLGATGLCSLAFIRKAIQSPEVNTVTTFSRRQPNIGQSEKVKQVVFNSSEWPDKFPHDADVVFSGIATTRAAAGGLDKQRLIDHDLQVKLAKEARDRGCKTFILISASMASSSSLFAYSKMKGETEEAIIKLGFEKTIILRPGPLLGKRESKHSGKGDGFISTVLPSLHRSYFQSIFMHPIYADEVADFALKASSKVTPGVHIFESKEMLDETKHSK